ncbi:MAG: hypothetical protein ACK2UI_12400 [Anaerolineae bacterium]
MPICRTCRGEYDLIVPPRSPSDESASDINTPVTRPRLCPRCGSDVNVWDRLDTTLADFIVQEGGILALLPAVAAMVVWLFWIPPEESGNYFPVLTFVCLGVCVLSFFMIYDGRLSWWEHRWAEQVYRTPHISLDSWIAATAIGGLFFSPLWVLYYTTAGRPVEFVSKALFAFIYVMAFVCLTAAITLVVVSEYLARVEKYAPPPIFVSTERLLRVVVNAAIEDINLPRPNAHSVAGFPNPRPVYEVLQALRIPENGGIHVLLRECKRVRYPDREGQMQVKWMEMLWRIQADRWGRVEILRPGSLEPYSVERRAFREIGRYSY